MRNRLIPCNVVLLVFIGDSVNLPTHLLPTSLFLSGPTGASKAELMMLTVSEVVRQLIEAHKEGRDVNLNK